MKSLSWFLLVLLGFTLFASCEGDEDTGPNCAAVLCPSNSAFLDYRDSDGNPLINTVFVKDSFKFFTPSTTQYIKPLPDGDNRLAVFFGTIETGTTYFLELDTEEIDTLNFNFTTTSTSCCTITTLDSLFYNGIRVPVPSGEQIVLTRD
ncbi:MAG: hypothetical protein Aureis2KO_14240 [Aureisphaera sp.]